MNKIFVILGKPQSGKDTFVNFIKSYHEDTLNFSSVDYIKWLSDKFLGVDVKNKDHKTRKFLSEFKRILVEYNDFAYVQCKSAIDTLQEGQVLFLHIREESEITKLQSEYPELKVVYVEGENSNLTYNNDSDDADMNKLADIVIHNTGGLMELNKTAKWFVETYIL